ncbi:hypothetical protein MMC29_004129, partial [Sticta canariensis]|nr:hypothetical protein [Sticta canariensis]
MAEIGLVASIFGVAAYGTQVATSLYETADVMIHAHQQIASMAKHVSQFTAVLRHLGRVLEAEKGNCSKELLRDIRKIKHSCKRTFKEINSTIRSKRSPLLIRVRWLFKKSKAKELEVRLDSEQSMLQTMIQSKDDSKQISGLREEIALLKTLIIENYNNVTELQRAEQSAEAERPLSLDSSLSESDEEGSGADERLNDNKSTQSRHQAEQENVESSAGNIQASSGFQKSAVQPLAQYDSPLKPGIHQTSALLLQMVPYRPAASNSRLISQSNGQMARSPNAIDTSPKPAMEEATKSIRLLLDKWTNLGSAPISDLLDEDVKAGNAHKERGPKIYRQRSRERYFPGTEYPSDELDPPFFPQSQHQVPPRPAEPYLMPGQLPQAPLFGTLKDLWISPHLTGQAPTPRSVGEDMLDALRSTGGGIVYAKKNDFEHLYFVDRIVTYRFLLVPFSLIPSNELEPLFTEIGKGWVRQEALDLFSYTYTETPSGHFCISGNLMLPEIEELVILSYQAVGRGLVERSRKVIGERGWNERVDAIVREISKASINRRPASAYNQANEPRNQRGDPGEDPESYFFTKTQTRRDPFGPSTIPHTELSPADLQITDSEMDSARETKSAAPKVTVTVHRKGGHKPNPNPAVKAREKELEKLKEKLEILKKRRDEAQKVKDLPLEADLTYYAIPDLNQRIEILMRDGEGDEKLSPNPATNAREKELEKLKEKLEILKKRRDEAEEAKDLEIAADLTYYAIPDLNQRIEILMRDGEGDEKISPNPATNAREKELEKLKEKLEILKKRRDEAEEAKDLEIA